MLGLRAAPLLLALATLAGACEDAPDPRSETSTSAPRVVSLVPAVTETLIALGRSETLVAVSDYCDPPDGPRRPRVGTGLTPAYEGIARAAPTLIVTEAPAARREALERIAPTLVLPWRTAAEASASIRRLGTAVDAGGEAEALADRYLRLDDASPAPDAPEVLAVLAPSGGDRLKSIWYVRSDSLHGAALSAAGLRNALPAPPSGPPELSLEALVRLDPAAVLVLAQNREDGERARTQLRALEVLQAAREDRVEVLVGPRLLHTGPGVLDLVPAIARVWGTASEP